MASATPWPSSLCCRPLTSRSRFPTSSVRCMSISTRALSMPTSASASASASYTAVKPENVQRQGEGPQDLDDDEDENERLMFDYANIMRCRGPYNVQIFVDENESEDALTDRFRREVYREGIIQECRRRRYHETRQDIKKRKIKESLRRNRHDRARRVLNRKIREETEDDETDDEDDEDDNWELPGEEIGF